MTQFVVVLPTIFFRIISKASKKIFREVTGFLKLLVNFFDDNDVCTQRFIFNSTAVRYSDNTKCNVKSGAGQQLPGSGSNRQARRNGPLDRDQKSNAKVSRNERDRAPLSGDGQGHKVQPPSNHATHLKSFDNAALSHQRVTSLPIDPSMSSQS